MCMAARLLKKSFSDSFTRNHESDELSQELLKHVMMEGIHSFA